MTSLIQKFSRLAIRETNFPDRAYGVADEAAACCIGAIGQTATNREDFIKGGLMFLDHFEETAGAVIEDRSQGDGANMELIDEIKILIEEAGTVDRDGFAESIGESWDHTHPDEED